MISVEEEDHQVAPLITRPAAAAPAAPAAAADKLEQIGNVFRLSSETFICGHCLNIALLLLLLLLHAVPSFNRSTIYSASHFPI